MEGTDLQAFESLVATGRAVQQGHGGLCRTAHKDARTWGHALLGAEVRKFLTCALRLGAKVQDWELCDRTFAQIQDPDCEHYGLYLLRLLVDSRLADFHSLQGRQRRRACVASTTVCHGGRKPLGRWAAQRVANASSSNEGVPEPKYAFGVLGPAHRCGQAGNRGLH